ncbi:hypothetical protein CAEBREN_23955 [Caenorhabditis brenneri]|uniref:SGNH domain-containing protein n=1 Tax=Caenorhabditis brenneri TaxID=135651 RepID=G0NM26_CAEBE|nr:hypothetical protein CAEBREN_23955 [Caenorhabditis brenneri]
MNYRWNVNDLKNLYAPTCDYESIKTPYGWWCEPLLVSADTDTCRANFTTFVERIKKEKPDYAFHITREVSIGRGFPPNVTTFDQDPTYQTMKGQMLKLIENIKNKLYIVHAIPSVQPGSISKIAEWVKNGTDPMVVQRALLRPHGFEMARKRYEQLVKDCNGKCILIDYTPIFYNNATKIYEYYDKKGFSYWTADQHFSPHGIEHIRHVWTGVCEQL